MNQKAFYSIEVCFSPQLIHLVGVRDSLTVVVADILRATTSIISAISNGASCVVPVADLNLAKAYKEQGYLVAAERDGKILDFADFGNSAFEFQSGRVTGKTLVFSTTNGTVAIDLAKQFGEVVLGGFSNLTSLASWLSLNAKNVLILCSGWKNAFCLEDTIFAGALIEKLLEMGNYHYNCDSAKASLDLWQIAWKDVMAYIEKATHRERLRQLGVDDVLAFSFETDTTEVVPVLKDGKIMKAERNEQNAESNASIEL